MSKLQMRPPLGAAAPVRLVVRAQRVARPPRPWAWAIHEEGETEPLRRSTRLYRCADDAWAVGRAVLERLPRSAMKAPVPAAAEEARGHDPAPG
jgi:hypothetical protein